MLAQYQDYLTLENIYLWVNFGIIPFWIMLILAPNSRVTQIFINSKHIGGYDELNNIINANKLNEFIK